METGNCKNETVHGGSPDQAGGSRRDFSSGCGTDGLPAGEAGGDFGHAWIGYDSKLLYHGEKYGARRDFDLKHSDADHAWKCVYFDRVALPDKVPGIYMIYANLSGGWK